MNKANLVAHLRFRWHSRNNRLGCGRRNNRLRRFDFRHGHSFNFSLDDNWRRFRRGRRRWRRGDENDFFLDRRGLGWFGRRLGREPGGDFGMGFYQGALSGMGAQQADVELAGSPATDSPGVHAHPLRTWAVGSFAAALVVGAAAGGVYYASHLAHENYDAARTREAAIRWRNTTEDRLLASRILLGAAGTAVAAGVLLWVLDHDDTGHAVAPSLSFGGGLEAGVTYSRAW